MTCRESTASTVPAIFCSLYRRHTHASLTLSTIYRLQPPPPLHFFLILLTFYMYLQIKAYNRYIDFMCVCVCVCVCVTWLAIAAIALLPHRVCPLCVCVNNECFHYRFGQTAIEDHLVYKALLFFFSKGIRHRRHCWLYVQCIPYYFCNFKKLISTYDFTQTFSVYALYILRIICNACLYIDTTENYCIFVLVNIIEFYLTCLERKKIGR